jgi:tetratricopeptide (TPR) repeat protein
VTTDGLRDGAEAIYKEFQAGTLTPERMVGAINLLRERAHYLGMASDYGRAAEVAESLVSARPNGHARLLQAQILTSLHRFSEAAAVLSSATDVPQTESLEQQATLALALGDVDKAVAIGTALATENPSLNRLGSAAIAVGVSGDLTRAQKLFHEALAKYRGASPLPITWLYFQWGLTLERFGKKGLARQFYEAAHPRLPQYAPLASHLAGLMMESGETQAAAALLRPIVEVADDPQYAGQLAEIESELGDSATADELMSRALSGYDRLLGQHKLAFADHAARFFLDAGHKRRAFALAQENLASRKTDSAYQLWFDAAFAAKADPQGACVTSDEAVVENPSAYLLFVRARAYRACGRSAEADQLLGQSRDARRQR